MKKMILSAAMILVSSVAMAQQRIDLAPGSSVRLNVGQSTIVTCDGTSSAAQESKCALNKDMYGRSEVITGGRVISVHSDLNEAIMTIKKLNEAGLCR